MNKFLVVAVIFLSVMLWAQVTAPTTFGFDVGPLTSCQSKSQVTICSAMDAAGVQGLYLSTKASPVFTKIATVGAAPVPATIPASFQCSSFTATNTVTSGATLSGCK